MSSCLRAAGSSRVCRHQHAVPVQARCMHGAHKRGLHPASRLRQASPLSSFRSLIQHTGWAVSLRAVKVEAEAPSAAEADSSTSQQQANLAQISELTDRLLTMETELQSMFSPGRPMPKAGEVAKVREEIESLKQQLADLLDSAPKKPPKPPAPPPTVWKVGANGPTKVGPAADGSATKEGEADKKEGAKADADKDKKQEGETAAAAKTEELVLDVELQDDIEKARLLLEGVVRGRNGWDPISAAEYNNQLAVLEAENERLRQEAHQLLLRQHQLEELAAKAGVIRSSTPAAVSEAD